MKAKSPLFYCIVFASVFILAGCKNVLNFMTGGTDEAPFWISTPDFIRELDGNSPGCFKFDFYNKADMKTCDIDVRFEVADPISSHFLREGTCSVLIDTEIFPDECMTLVIPLEDFTYAAPGENMELIRFFIARINYEDGSTWKDSYGQFDVMR